MKSLFTILCSLFITTFLLAQVDFNQSNLIAISTGMDGPTSAFAADLDGDGDLDMLATSRRDNKVVWYENLDGQGDYGVQKIISSNEEEPGNGIAYDLDNDGDLDVIISTSATSDSRLYWYENVDGTGNFSLQQFIYGENYIIEKIFAIDIDNDGDLDIATGDSENHFWFENTDGQGTFGGKQDLTTTSSINIQDFGFFDIDNDGDLDIVSCGVNPFFNQPDEIAWFINEDGQGSFSPKQFVDDTVEGPTAIDAADIDGDGDLDILTASSTNGDVAWHENGDGFGMFNSKVVIDPFVNAKEVLGRDVDGDGDQDVIVGYSGGNIELWENTDGQGDFDDGPITFLQSSADFILTADLNGDGELDVYSTDVIGNRVAWYANIGQGDFELQQQITASVPGVIKVDCADMDGDGDLDMVSLSLDWRDNKIAWYPNLGNGEYGDQQIAFLTADLMNDFDLMDMDGDGFVDIVATKNGIGDEIFYLQNDGQGNFEEIGINSTSIARVIIAGDFNGDGHTDIMRANNQFVSLFKNIGNGNGWFDDMPVTTTGALTDIESIFAADIDGDGDLDFVSGVGGGIIGWHENDTGDGFFSPRQDISTDAGEVYDVYAADVDGDGDMDVLSASYDVPGEILWFENLDGQGTFSAEKIIVANAEDARTVSAADMDGDGDLDVIYAASNENGAGSTDKVAWIENLDGQGNFGVENILLADQEADGARSIHVGDFDGNGSIDMAIAAEFDDKIILLENDGVVLNKFTGRIRRDVDGNGCDDNDPVVPDLLVGTVSSTLNSTFSLENGFYQIFVPAGIYDLRLYQEDYFDSDPFLFSRTFSGTGEVETVDFCLTPNTTTNDISVVIIPIDEPRPGFEMNYELIYKNIGTENASGTVTLNFEDQDLIFLSSDEAPTTQSNNQFTFDYTDLAPFDTRSIQLTFEVMQPPVVEAGDSLALTATITPVAADVRPNDNEYELKTEVINSFDPNDIRVLEGDTITVLQLDDYLHYIIRFQNVGTASAVNVVIEQFIDFQLEERSLELLSSSHFVRAEIEGDSNYKWIFDNINLPDSTSDEAGSNGYIAYRIRLTEFADVGDVVTEGASIFFDFNSPIFTNTASTEIIGVSDVEPPIAQCNDVTLSIDEEGNSSPLTVFLVNNDSSDDIGIENFELSQTSFSCEDIGTTTVVLTVTDSGGNMDSCNSIVTIIDEIPPSIITQTVDVDLAGNPSIMVTPQEVNNGSFDNCEISSLTLEPNTFDLPGVYTSILTATDSSGNISTSEVTINVLNILSVNNLLEEDLFVSPNPVQDNLTIELTNYEIGSVTIHSMLGNPILESKHDVIDVSELAAGVYYLVLRTQSDLVGVRRFVKI